MTTRTDIAFIVLGDVLAEPFVRLDVKYANLRAIQEAAKRMADEIARRLLADGNTAA